MGRPGAHFGRLDPNVDAAGQLPLFPDPTFAE
jgi:hypothetical protein